jgi:hypothetical protein
MKRIEMVGASGNDLLAKLFGFGEVPGFIG